MIKTNLNTQSGRSMIEMLGVLAIVGVLSVGGIAGYSKAMTKFKINKTADQISQIVTNIRTLYAQQTTYDGLNTATAIQMGVTPSEMGTGTTLTNPFNGAVLINYSYNKGFTIEIGSLPKEACVTLATYDWGSSYSSGFIGMGIYNSAVQSLDIGCSDASAGTWCSSQGPMTVTTAATGCSDDSVYNWLFLKFY